MKVVIADCSWNSYDEEIRNLPKDADIVCAQISQEDELIKACKDADAVLAEYAPLTRRVLEQLKKVKIISNTAIGVDNIDVAAAKDLGIAVANVPNYCAYEVADHAMALMLASMRNIVVYERKVRQGIWDINDAPTMQRIAGQKLGLLGFGRIPQMVSERAKGFGMEVKAYDPYLPKEVAAKFGVELVSFDEILQDSDVVSCHLPLMPATQGIINKEVFGKMVRKPLFINTSRGKVVNEADMIEALKTGQIKAAALDVLVDEPADFDSEIFQLDNVIITPHAGFFSTTALQEVRSRSALNVTKYFENDYSNINFIVKPVQA
jgi:D-3-phosphoglycerate dehydrogenase